MSIRRRRGLSLPFVASTVSLFLFEKNWIIINPLITIMVEIFISQKGKRDAMRRSCASRSLESGIPPPWSLPPKNKKTIVLCGVCTIFHPSYSFYEVIGRSFFVQKKIFATFIFADDFCTKGTDGSSDRSFFTPKRLFSVCLYNGRELEGFLRKTHATQKQKIREQGRYTDGKNPPPTGSSFTKAGKRLERSFADDGVGLSYSCSTSLSNNSIMQEKIPAFFIYKT